MASVLQFLVVTMVLGTLTLSAHAASYDQATYNFLGELIRAQEMLAEMQGTYAYLLYFSVQIIIMCLNSRLLCALLLVFFSFAGEIIDFQCIENDSACQLDAFCCSGHCRFGTCRRW